MSADPGRIRPHTGRFSYLPTKKHQLGESWCFLVVVVWWLGVRTSVLGVDVHELAGRCGAVVDLTEATCVVHFAKVDGTVAVD